VAIHFSTRLCSRRLAVGQALFTHYLLLVEVAAMLLLAALVAAYHLGKREPSAEEDKE
jgi:NADH-quinone oxidoreductase subunit J